MLYIVGTSHGQQRECHGGDIDLRGSPVFDDASYCTHTINKYATGKMAAIRDQVTDEVHPVAMCITRDPTPAL